MIERVASDFAIGAKILENFEDGKIHPCNFTPRKLSAAEFNYNVSDKEMLAIVYSLEKWRNLLQGSGFKDTIFSDHQNLSHFMQMVLLNRRQGRWAEFLKDYNLSIVYRKGTANQEADIHSRCSAYTSRVGGTTAVMDEPLLAPEQWLEIGAMEIEEDDDETIEIGALDIDNMIPGQKEKIKQDTMLEIHMD